MRDIAGVLKKRRGYNGKERGIGDLGFGGETMRKRERAVRMNSGRDDDGDEDDEGFWGIKFAGI